MTDAARQLPKIDSDSFSVEKPQPTSLISRRDIVRRLRRGKTQRSRFVESHISKTLAFQIRSLRDKEGWSQQRLAEEIGSNQNAVYRAENPSYGKQTITTLKKIAAAFDVALVVRFVPFSELTDWVSGTPRVIEGLNSEALDVSDFDTEEKEGKLEVKEQQEPERSAMTAAERNLREQTGGDLTPDLVEHLRQYEEGRASVAPQDFALTIKPGEWNTLQRIFEPRSDVVAAFHHSIDRAMQMISDSSSTSLTMAFESTSKVQQFETPLAVFPPREVTFIDSEKATDKKASDKAKRSRQRKHGSGRRLAA